MNSELQVPPLTKGDHWRRWQQRLPKLKLAGFLHRQRVVSQTAQFIHDRQREVFIGIELRHGSGVLVFADLLVDFVAMGADIRPSAG